MEVPLECHVALPRESGTGKNVVHLICIVTATCCSVQGRGHGRSPVRHTRISIKFYLMILIHSGACRRLCMHSLHTQKSSLSGLVFLDLFTLRHSIDGSNVLKMRHSIDGANLLEMRHSIDGANVLKMRHSIDGGNVLKIRGIQFDPQQ